MEAWKEAWSPPPKLKVSEWADQNRILSVESSAEYGRWITSRAEYQRGMMDACNEIGVRKITLMTSAQVGKTEIINNITGYFIDNQPAPMMVLQPTVDMGKAWSNDRLSPMVRDTPVLRTKVGNRTKGSKSVDNILHKQFVGGQLTIAGSNSPASLASRPIRILLMDETDRYPESAGEEGDPVGLATARTKTFWNKLIIDTSTPVDEHLSKISKSFELSDKRYWFCPCPHCGKVNHMQWKNIQIPKLENGDYDTENTFMVCEFSGCVIEEKHRQAMIRKGKWIATAGMKKEELIDFICALHEDPSLISPAKSREKNHIGFAINQLASPWVTWAETATDFMSAKSKGKQSLKTFVNTAFGETWKEKSDKADVTVETLLERRESYVIPDEVLFLTCAGDIQLDRIEMLVQGWSSEMKRWDIEHKIFRGDPVKDKVIWDEVDEFLKKRYGNFPISCTAIDSGGQKGVTDVVYNFCKPRSGRRIFPIKGSSKYYTNAVSHPRQAGKQRVSLYEIGTDTIKDHLFFTYLPDPKIVHVADWADEEYFSQLLGEKRIQSYKNGVAHYKWDKTRERQEVLDLYVYNQAAYEILDPDIDVLLGKKNYVEPEEPEEPKPEPTTRKVRPLRRKKTNFVNDYR